MKITGQEIFEHAKNLYQNSDFEGLQSVADSCIENKINEIGWILTAISAMLIFEIKKGFAVIDSGSHNLSRLSMAGKVGRCILDFEGYSLLEMIQNQSVDRLDHAIWLYFGGCAKIMKSDLDAAFLCFDNFRDTLRPLLVAEGLAPFIEDENLNLILRQGGLCFGPAETERRIKSFKHLDKWPDFDILYPISASGPIFTAASNGLYFEKFGYQFANRLLMQKKDTLLHLHISKPQSGFMEIYKKLVLKFPERVGLAITPDPPYSTATYFSCERFFVTDFLLEEYKRPIVTLDIDITPTTEAPDFHNFVMDFDFSCFETDRNEPASICSAAVMAWNYSSGAKKFLKGILAFCLSGELENSTVGSWMLDQASIYCVKNYFNKVRPSEVNFADMRITGTTLDNAIYTFASENEKMALRLEVSNMEKRQINI